MKTQNFEKLIQSITGRDFIINTNDQNIELNTEYSIYKILPISKRKIHFKWITPKNEEKILKSFITAFSTKYFEPNPAQYTGRYSTKWEEMTKEHREFAYCHHKGLMYRKEDLLNQIQMNFENETIYESLIKYGFYSTEYGIGIFVVFASQYVTSAIKAMHDYLTKNNIPFSNEFSDAKWVYRFKLNISKEKHNQILTSF